MMMRWNWGARAVAVLGSTRLDSTRFYFAFVNLLTY